MTMLKGLAQNAIHKSSRRSMACSCVARLSGRCERAAKARSKHATASRRAERVIALVPACRQYATALSQTSPRKA